MYHPHPTPAGLTRQPSKTYASTLIKVLKEHSEVTNFTATTPCGKTIHVFDHKRSFDIQSPVQGETSWLANGFDQHWEITPEKGSSSIKRGRPIDELFWTLGYYTQSEALSGLCRRDDVVKVNRWPNLTRLPHQNSFHRIAALLTTRPTSIVLASKLLSLPETEVSQFYQAAACASYTTVINRKTTHFAQPQQLQQRPNHSLISRIFQRLAR